MRWGSLSLRQLLELAAPWLCPCRRPDDFLRRHARQLRRLAHEEVSRGGYTVWLSRAVDTLDELEQEISR